MAKSVVLKILLVVLFPFVANWIYSTWLYESDIQKHSNIVNLVREIPENTEILYFGESSNNTFRGDDMDKRSISDFIGDHYPNLSTYGITKNAAHAGVYKVLLKHIPQKTKVKTLIITMNLRSFNAQWIYSDLETALQKSLVLLRSNPPLLNRFLLSFKAYDIKTPEERELQFKRKWREDLFDLPFDFPFKNVSEWDAFVWKEGVKNPDGSVNHELKALVCHYIKAYAFQIDTATNPRIRDFDEIVDYARKNNWNLVFNLLAENTEKAQKIVGDELIYMMNQNAKLLESYYSKKGVVVVNNLSAVEDEQFIDQDWTTEHYAEFGRKIIARNVALSLKKWHKNQFQSVQLSPNFQTTFFNNCDENLPWGQSHTQTEERSFSGKKSSRVGAGNDYSITMEYPLKKIPDSLKNQIHISFMLYLTSNIEDAILVFEAHGENFENYWLGFKINEITNTTNQWVKIEKTLIIEEYIKHADVIKTYVFNPSKQKLFVDDFEIRIE